MRVSGAAVRDQNGSVVRTDPLPVFRRRIAVLLLLLLACVALGGWVLVAPALPVKGAVVVEPPADADLRRAPSDAHAVPPPAASSIVAVAAPVVSPEASAAGDDGSPELHDPRCGEDQVPVILMPQPDADGNIRPEEVKPDPDGVLRHLPGEVKPGGPGYAGAMLRLDAALRASTDPFDRAMADRLDLPLITPPAMRQDALVHDALGADDARVYRLAYATCYPNIAFVLQGPLPAAAPSCAQLSAETWARLDPGNAEPWLYALDRADTLGDVGAQRAALARLAESTRLDIHFFAGSAAVARQRMRDVDLAAQTTSAMQAIGTAEPPFQSLTRRCHNLGGGDPALAATCDRVAAVFYEHSDSFIGRAIGGSLHRLATGDPTWLDRAHQEQHERAGFAMPESDGGPCGLHRATLAQFIEMDKFGELRLARRAASGASR
jgi:hypothetical protein